MGKAAMTMALYRRAQMALDQMMTVLVFSCTLRYVVSA